MMASFFVLFVCKANMCRSPTAHAIFRKKVQDLGLDSRVWVDSASTHDYYPESPPDARSQTHAAKRGYDLSDLRSRHIQPADFDRADLILVMDWNNLHALQGMCPHAHLNKVRRLAEFCQAHNCQVVPDPYYGEPGDFEHVLNLVEDACEGLISHLRVRWERDAPG